MKLWRRVPQVLEGHLEPDGYPSLAFETWYQQGMRCYQARLPRHLRKQAFRAVADLWTKVGGTIRRWHLQAFAYGAQGRDAQGRRCRRVPEGYCWPEAPGASWGLVVCSYPDGETDLDFVHPVSGRFWSEDNGFLPAPEPRTDYFNRLWYEQMGFDLLNCSPNMRLGMSARAPHLSLAF